MAVDKYGDKRASSAGAKMVLDLAVDDAKVRQIQACLKKGKLTITLDSTVLADANRAAGIYAYD